MLHGRKCRSRDLQPRGLLTALVASQAVLANLAKRNLARLTALVKTRLKRIQYRPALLEGFLASTGLDLAPSVTPTIRDL